MLSHWHTYSDSFPPASNPTYWTYLKELSLLTIWSPKKSIHSSEMELKGGGKNLRRRFPQWAPSLWNGAHWKWAPPNGLFWSRSGHVSYQNRVLVRGPRSQGSLWREILCADGRRSQEVNCHCSTAWTRAEPFLSKKKQNKKPTLRRKQNSQKKFTFTKTVTANTQDNAGRDLGQSASVLESDSCGET